MSKIKEFENIPEIDIDGAETLEEAVEDCKALYAKFDKELDGTESTPLARCNEARLLLLTLAHRSHHVIEYATAALKAQLPYQHGHQSGQRGRSGRHRTAAGWMCHDGAAVYPVR